MIKHFKMAAFIGVAFFALPAFAGDQSCEVIVLDTMENESQDAVVAATKFLPGDAFIASIYDDEDGHVKTAGDLPIRAVMCRRDDIIPTLRDVPLIQTGLSLTLSQDFDSADSGLLIIYDSGEDYKAEYSGPPLTEAQEVELADILKVFDLQRLVQKDMKKDVKVDTEALTENVLIEDTLPEDIPTEDVITADIKEK